MDSEHSFIKNMCQCIRNEMQHVAMALATIDYIEPMGHGQIDRANEVSSCGFEVECGKFWVVWCVLLSATFVC